MKKVEVYFNILATKNNNVVIIFYY